MKGFFTIVSVVCLTVGAMPVDYENNLRGNNICKTQGEECVNGAPLYQCCPGLACLNNDPHTYSSFCDKPTQVAGIDDTCRKEGEQCDQDLVGYECCPGMACLNNVPHSSLSYCARPHPFNATSA